MALNNTKHAAFVKYFDIQYIADEKRWYVWYFVTENFKELEQTLAGKDPQENS